MTYNTLCFFLHFYEAWNLWLSSFYDNNRENAVSIHLIIKSLLWTKCINSIYITVYNKTYLPVFHSLTFCGDHNFYDVRELVMESISFFLEWSSDIMNVENVNIVYDEETQFFSQLINSTIRSIFHKFDKIIDVSNTLMNKLGSNLPSQWELTLRIWLQLIWEKNCLLLRFCLFR